jgi:putative ABC transport system substrate-binding protein
MTFDNGTATVNTETAEALGLDYDKLVETLSPYCTKVQAIKTSEYFE